jgi:predicted DNA-binding transcriptional regulator YafY
MVGRPPKKYSQAERVLELYRRLLQPGGFVSPALDYPDFNCDKRTLQRDVAVLREVLGDDLEHVEDVGLGWVYRLTRPREWEVEPSQVLAIVAGANATRFVSGRKFSNEIQPILEQLRSSLKHGEKLQLRRVEKKAYVTRTGEKRYEGDDRQTYLGHLIDGLMLQTPVSLGYLSHTAASRGLAPMHLVTHPLSIVFHRGGVYFVVDVIAGDQHVGNRISVALDRITDSAPRDDLGVFEYPTDYSAEAFFAEAFRINLFGDLQHVELRISEFMKPYVLERYWNDSATFEELEDGSLKMRISIRGDFEVMEWVAGMGVHPEVLAPQSMREKMKERLQKALELYSE